jgi:hypothetical protein
MDFIRYLGLKSILENCKPYWQQYTNGINMTTLDCDSVENCQFMSDENNLLTTIVPNDDSVNINQ